MLLDSPKTTGELAKSLNYIDKNGRVQYNVIDKDLEALEKKGIIHSSKVKKTGVAGAPPATYEILYETSVLISLLGEYPFLIEDYQKNDNILDMLLKKHPSFSSPHNLMFYKLSAIEVEARIQKERDDFKKKLKSSQTFFKICFMNDSENIVNIFTHMYWVFITEYSNDNDFQQTEISLLNRLLEKARIKENCDDENSLNAPVSRVRLRNMGYKVCFFMDVLNGSPVAL